MGYGLGPASASALKADGARRSISFIGDGGFWHNGLTSSIGNAVYNQQDGVIVIVDNYYSAATGGQDLLSSRATNRTKSTHHPIARAVRGMGVKWVRQIDRTYDVPKVRAVLTEALTTDTPGPKVIVASSECMLNRQRRERPERARLKAQGARLATPRFGVDEGDLHRRPCLHAPIGLPVAGAEAARRPAPRRPGRRDRRILRRLRQLRRGGGCRRPLPLVLPRRRDRQPDLVGPHHGAPPPPHHRLAGRVAGSTHAPLSPGDAGAHPPSLVSKYLGGAGAEPPLGASHRAGTRRMNAPAAIADTQIIKLAIMAVGGQGGGVLTNWIVDLAEARGWRAQSTAVAGVAQRTGATIYYIEMAPDTGRDPVFALAPAPGDVDILIAAEWMEAGRAVIRGFVTPDRTTLIASTHRALAVSEKIVPGDGHADGAEVAEALTAAAVRVVAFDMQTPAIAAGSVISATLFGALAGSGALPFDRADFEAVIRAGGRGVEPSLAAFRAGLEGPEGDTNPSEPEPRRMGFNPSAPPEVTGPPALLRDWQALLGRTDAFAPDTRDMARAGLQKVVDFQDLAYGAEYLDRLAPFVVPGDPALAMAAAKYIANAMAYDDLIRVADLKTRGARARRIRAEMAAGERVMHLTEFMHPRAEEFCGTLPARLGAWIEARPRLVRAVDRAINHGRRVRSDSIFGFTTLWLIGGLRRWRRWTLRHRVETAHLTEWLDLALATAATDPRLATEILATRRLIKGYSDTHARGMSKYDRVLAALPMLAGREDAADWLRRLREAALQDEKGEALDGALRTIASFAEA